MLVTRILYYFTEYLTATLQYAHYGNFINECSTLALLRFLIPMAVFVLATNESFIKFNLTVKLFLVVLFEGFTYAVRHKPSRFLSSTNIIRQLHRRYTLRVASYHIDGIKPLTQRDFRAFEQRTYSYVEVLACVLTTIHTITSAVNF